MADGAERAGKEAVQRRLGQIETLAGADAAPLAHELFAHAAKTDVLGDEAGRLAIQARRLWSLMERRTAKTPNIRVEISPAGLLPKATIEIVNDDMPFLVDSVTAELDRHGFEIDRILHPIVLVERDASGLRLAIGRGAKESVMRIEASGRDLSVTAEGLEADLRRVLADVRAAVEDWPEMRARLRAAIDGLTGAPGVAHEDVEEARAFLAWLDADHFTFIGYREYRYDDERMHVAPGSGLGVLRSEDVRVLGGARDLPSLPEAGRELLRRPSLLLVTKSAEKSTVHRRTHLDLVGVRRLDPTTGAVLAELRFVGLYTSRAYSENPIQVPLLRRKIAQVLDRTALDPASHDGKALAHILETWPRDELFQIELEELTETALAVLALQERRAVAVFLRRDPFERFVSAMVYVPETRYNLALRQRIADLLRAALAGVSVDLQAMLHNPPLVRLTFIVQTNPGAVPDADADALTAELALLSRTWTERLGAALDDSRVKRPGELLRRYARAFPTAYVESHGVERALDDLALIERAHADGGIACALSADGQRLSVRVAQEGAPVNLSDVLPMLERRGLRVLTEGDFRIEPESRPAVHLHDFEVEPQGFAAADAARRADAFVDGFLAGWRGLSEEDGLNRLILAAGLRWRDVALIRTMAKFLKQAGFQYAQATVEDTLVRHPAFCVQLVALFHARHDPARERRAADATAAEMAAAYAQALDAVASLDDDRILRRLLDVAERTLRTNFFQRAADGGFKPEIALKLDSAKLDGLPKPRPHVEIFLCSPRVEAVHLRGGPVARGGIRWSDRRDDFRTEVLGLMKAQMVKNTVIVPTGSKGGFVVKRPPPAAAGRPALLEEVQACYRAMMGALLDVTDNRVGGTLAPPAEVVRRDGDDPYLVVAADKGTATFSDLANSIAVARGFWLDDAFASGGSAGYDHKGLGITAAGAWVAVERHLREAGIDWRRDGLTVIGVGDMSGDVFGNGMLHSDRLRLVAAFDHRHIFLDPDPDLAAAFAERQRMFALKGSSWADYDAAKLSPGGQIVDRAAKRVELSEQVRARLGIDAVFLTPAELMNAILKAPADLLWFGGIGTFIKAKSESHAEVGDRVNDGIRVDGDEIRAKVVGEGANLGATQRGRIAFAQKGGRINTDAIDNSAGVDCSDHEVNLKILLGDAVAAGRLDRAGRDALLAEMAGEVCRLVLRANYLQTQALSMAERAGAALIDEIRPLCVALEGSAGLDRELERLPTDAEMATRRNTGQGLTRPELAVVIGFTKLDLYPRLLESGIVDDPSLEADLLAYFPQRLAEPYGAEIRRHGLRRELIGTILCNEIVHRGGIAFVDALARASGATVGQVARGYVVMRALLDLPALWAAVEALDGIVDPAAQTDALLLLAETLRAAVAWELRRRVDGPAAARIAQLAPDIAALAAAARAEARAPEALGPDLARRIDQAGAVAAALDVVTVASDTATPVGRAATAFFMLQDALRLEALKGVVAKLPTADPWMRQAAQGMADDLNLSHRRVARQILREPGDGLVAWLNGNAEALERLDRTVAELTASATPSLPKLVVAERMVRGLV